MRAIMEACGHPNVGVCWNCNDGEVQNGSIRGSFDLLKGYIKNVHLRDLPDYPSKELFALLAQSGYDRYTLAEVQESKEPDRFLSYYRALWVEMQPDK
jgi:hypothetical protein